MAEKVQKTCSNCETKYTITWNIEEQDLEPLTCPFCGFEVDNEQEDVEWVNKDEEDDNWN
jgi:DNA-directed RNA polymerase subunit RPC12/RpoP